MNYQQYIHFLSYPKEGWECVLTDYKARHEHSERFGKYLDAIGELTRDQVEEMFTSTFDIQAGSCLDVGFVLFGEDYKRGEFLVGISSLQREYKVNLESELADHLPNMLKLVERMQVDAPMRREVIECALIPSVTKMIETFTPGDEFCNPYKFLLQDLKSKLEIEISQPTGEQYA